MDGAALLTIALLILGFGLLSHRAENSLISPPLAFTAFGIFLGAPALGLIHFEGGLDVVHVFAELTLVIVLFTDAARIELTILRREHHLPVRLLGLGLPLSVLLGTGAAMLVFPSLSFFAAALLAAILAPTDAALGQAVVENRLVPVRIRQALNVESGLNDGMALPLILALAACAETGALHNMSSWIWITVQQLTLGPIVGVMVGSLGARVVPWAARAQWMNPRYEQLVGLSLAFVAYAGAEEVGGNGFIAAFVAGLTLGARASATCRQLVEFTETEGRLLVLITFFLVGAALVWPVLPLWDLRVALYALLSLTFIRMLPVALSLLGLRLLPLTTLFVGWFGPRGLASILFGVIVTERMNIPERDLIFSVVVATALLSIVAHGFSAGPVAKRYGAYLRKMGGDEPLPEHVPVTEHRLRSTNF